MDPAVYGTIAGSLITGFFGFIALKLQRKKHEAEAAKIQAEAEKIEAESDDLSSARLIRELDRLALSCSNLQAMNDKQFREIETLRQRIYEYAAREAAHAIEKRTMQMRIEELERDQKPPQTVADAIGTSLRQATPLELPHHVPNEFEADDHQTDEEE